MAHDHAAEKDNTGFTKSSATAKGKVKDIEKLDLSDWPNAWKDEEDDGTEGANLDTLLSDAYTREKYWESLGVPYRRVILDAYGMLKFQSRQWVSLLAAKSDQHDDKLDIEYVALSRNAAADQPGKATVYSYVGSSVQGVDWVVVPVFDAPRLQAEGWELWLAPRPAFEMSMGYIDTRRIPKPVDVLTAGQPAADFAYFLEYGSKIVASGMTRNKWVPGQLIDEGGSGTEIIAQSPTHAPFTPESEWMERRSVTSTGHVRQYRRPMDVGLGWGGHDQFHTWEAYGRRVAEDKVEAKEYSTDRLAPVTVVDKGGKSVRTVKMPFADADLKCSDPKSLYDILRNKADKSKPKPPAGRRFGTMDWA